MKYLKIAALAIMVLLSTSGVAEPVLLKNKEVNVTVLSYYDAKDLFSGIPLYDSDYDRIILVIQKKENDAERIFVNEVLDMNYNEYRRNINIMRKVNDHIVFVSSLKEAIDFLTTTLSASVTVSDDVYVNNKDIFILEVK